MKVWILFKRDPYDDAPWEVYSVYTNEDRAKEDQTHLEIDEGQNHEYNRTKFYIDEYEVNP